MVKAVMKSANIPRIVQGILPVAEASNKLSADCRHFTANHAASGRILCQPVAFRSKLVLGRKLSGRLLAAARRAEMPVSIPDFWTLLVASRLASRSSIPKLQEQFSQVKGADTQGNVVTLAQWLISQGTISRYQAKVLLAGHAGPFAYGDYTVFDRHGEGRLQGAFRALHPATRHRVLLWFHSGAVVQNPQWWSTLTEQVGTFARVVDPCVARVYHLCDIGQFKFTALEDLQGEAAEERLRKGPLT